MSIISRNRSKKRSKTRSNSNGCCKMQTFFLKRRSTNQYNYLLGSITFHIMTEIWFYFFCQYIKLTRFILIEKFYELFTFFDTKLLIRVITSTWYFVLDYIFCIKFILKWYIQFMRMTSWKCVDVVKVFTFCNVVVTFDSYHFSYGIFSYTCHHICWYKFK